MFPLFPVRFVNDLGVYEPGTLAAAERARLPADAIPVVQQLIFWSPWDTGMYWLLAELYAANNRLREAEIIFNQCADGRQFANRRIFMDHRAAVREAVAKLPLELPPEDVALTPDRPLEPTPDPGASLPPKRTVILAAAGFAVVAVGLLALQIRAARRRPRPAEDSR